MKANYTKKIIFSALAAFALPLFAQAQNASAKDTYLSNPLFLFLLAVIILLIALIAVLGNTLQNIAKSDYLAEKVRKMKDKADTSKNIGVILLFVVLSQTAFAQNSLTNKEVWQIGGLDYFTFYFMIGVILCEIAIVTIMFFVMKNLLREEKTEVVKAAVVKPKERNLMDVFNASVEIEHEGEIMLDHNYDGIKELDNNLPPWWKYGFYLTVVVAFIYMIHYHVAKTGDLQEAEYKKEVAKAEADVAAYLKNSANNVDETNVKLLTEPSDLAAAKEIFTGICATCHGKMGEGNSIGPNLTDEYWLHGGSIQDIFKTIKYGWVDKGMQSWKDSYSPVQIAQLTSYIKSLKGTNPPNAKEKQGDLYIEQIKMDSTNLKIDSLKIIPPIDSLKKNVAEAK